MVLEASKNKDGSFYTYKESLRIMFTPYIIMAVLWIPMTLWTEKYVSTDPLLCMCVVDNLATLICFVASCYYKNTSIYDPYWHLPSYLVVFHFIYSTTHLFSILKLISGLLPIIYFTRHNYNYFSFWPGMQYQDFRYIRFEKWLTNPIVYWTFSLIGLHIIPTFMVFFGVIPTWLALQATEEPNLFVFYAGAILSLGGITFEMIGDMQLQPWRTGNSTGYIDQGLWRYTRHPNLFGESCFWTGLFINSMAYGLKYWPGAIGPVFMVGIIVIYSVPVMEDHLLKKRPTYADQQKRVSVLIPWFRTELIKKE